MINLNWVNFGIYRINVALSFSDVSTLSSLPVVELATILEQRYKLNFSEIGFDQYAFDSVDSIVELISG